MAHDMAGEGDEAEMVGDAGADKARAAVVLRKKDLVARVVAASGARKDVARDVTDAVLRELGLALAAGESLTLPPLGRLRVVKRTQKAGGEMLQIRLRRSAEADASESAEKTADDPLAKAED